MNASSAQNLNLLGAAGLAGERPLSGDSLASGREHVVELQVGPRRAYDLLAKQPVSLLGLDPLDRSLVVVAAVADEHGKEHVVTQVGDAVWDLRSWDWPPNIAAFQKYVAWPEDLPSTLLEDAQNAFYAWLKRGKPGGKPVAATTFCETVRRAATTLRFLASRGISRFSQVAAVDVADLHAHLKHGLLGEPGELSEADTKKVRRTPVTVRQYMEVLNLVLTFPADVLHPLVLDPWEGCSLARFVGAHRPSGVGKTGVMPRRVVEAIFSHCEAVLERAPRLLDLWEAGDVMGAAGLVGVDQTAKFKNVWQGTFQRVLEIRDAVLFMVEISTGMRNSEAIGLRLDSWRGEFTEQAGMTFHWLTTVEHKTGKGRCDFLAPGELIPALELLARWAKPYQAQLQAEISRLEGLLRATDGEVVSEGLTRVEALQLLGIARQHATSLFLSVTRRRVNTAAPVMPFGTCNDALARLAKAAKVDWTPRNHECRRTFAWTIANSRIGRFALIFLKWQFKHSTMSMTQLYASNPHQDQDLYDEIYEATVEAQTEVLLECFEEGEGVAGGFGQALRNLRDGELRGIAVRDKDALIRHTAKTETLRNNGHAYCMADRRACGGNGLFDAGWCVDCDDSLIKSKEHLTFWWNWLVLSRDLFAVADCGEGVQARAEKDIAYAEKVFADLGHPAPPADATYINYPETSP